ncbi:MAG: hypothetical protein PF572_06155 [Patescibacteria group bacterium]|jgi:hypothetical protein|nr:hypothetical protein [Patescibacteria group bacterium]
MKKTIQILSIALLLLVLSGIIIFFFNPLNLRNKIIGSMVNYYFQVDALEKTGAIGGLKENTSPTINVNPETGEVVPQDKNPLLSTEQEERLESFGVDVEALPKAITPGMTTCFIDKLGAERTNEIVAGATPGPLEILRTKECLSQ